MTGNNLINAAECPHRNPVPEPSLKCTCGKDNTTVCDLKGRFIDFRTALPPYECPLTTEKDWETYYRNGGPNGRTA